MAYKNTAFVSWLKQTVNKPTIYMWGTYGNKVTESLIKAKKNQYSTHYPTSRINILRTHIGKRYGCDCCGLIKWYLMTNGGTLSTPVYSGKYDNNASQWYALATEKGPISTIPEIAGIAVYKKGHIGIYIGNGKVIECTLSRRGDGVVYSNLKDEKWTHWLKIPYITYGATLPPKGVDIDKLVNEVIKGKWGNNPVREQKIVAKYGEAVYKQVRDKVNAIYK